MKIATVTQIGNLRNYYYDEVLLEQQFVGTYFEEDPVPSTIGIPSKDVMLISPFDAWTMEFEKVDDPTRKWWQIWKGMVLQKTKKKHITGTAIEVRDGKKRLVYCVGEPYDKVKAMLED